MFDVLADGLFVGGSLFVIILIVIALVLLFR